MKVRIESTIGEDKSVIILPLLAIQIVNNKLEVGIGWLFWLITFKSE